ncbi:hypothetical protein OS493_035187 [Desmophyllum pertusum]|uniref:Uncharacterized protein n=1 Tax=Desmophyllum pertusum TaxID=174260 RepID=A0A9X0CDW4_9CNID|nr:hypothetical protein OS493_035187 [Desmophyllum pertusum]
MADLFYPDNPKREARMYELVDDVGTLVNDLVNDAGDIKRLFAKVDVIVRELYSHISVPIPSSHMKKFEFHGSKLRDAIHGAVHPRIQLKKAAIINGMLRAKLNTIVDSFGMMKQLGYTQQQLDGAQRNIAAEFVTEVSQITDQTALTELGVLDRSRGSWTNEDFK